MPTGTAPVIPAVLPGSSSINLSSASVAAPTAQRFDVAPAASPA